jgi:phosphatidate cytidylyltransferase
VLQWRLLLGALLIAGCGGLFWLDGIQALGAPPAAWLFPLAVIGVILGTNDLLWLCQARQWQPSPRVMLAGNLAIVLSNAVPLFWPDTQAARALGPWGWPILTALVMLLAAFVAEMRRYLEPGKAVLHLGLICFAWMYLGMLLSVFVQLRAFGDHARGLMALASLILLVKLSDIGAFTVGRLLGRHPMTPVLSPGKTWEGAAGAIVFSCAGAALIEAMWVPNLPVSDWSTDPGGTLDAAEALWSQAGWWGSNAGRLARWLAFGVLLAIAGMTGDLAESLIKRDVGRKDSGNWLPGFGGILDLLDSVLFAGPVAYLCWVVGLVP